jgi:hypothetical protein
MKGLAMQRMVIVPWIALGVLLLVAGPGALLFAALVWAIARRRRRQPAHFRHPEARRASGPGLACTTYRRPSN